jgi:hypothetical protein
MIDWTIEELHNQLEEIITGEKLIRLDQDPAGPIFVLFKYPPKAVIRQADKQGDLTVFQAKKDNFMTEEEMLDLLKKRGTWTEKEEEAVEKLRSKIKKWEEKLNNSDLGEGSRKSLTAIKSKLEDELWKVEVRRENSLAQSVERVGRKQKFDYLVWLCSYDVDTQDRMWANYLTYYKDLEENLRIKLLNELRIFLDGHSTEEIRYIARHNLWRIQYINAQKSNTPLFPGAVVQWTPDQLNLVWWSSYYQGIYEMLPEDQPDDWVIDDDDELDKYMSELHKERVKDRATRVAEKKYGPSTAMKMKEVLITQAHPDYEHLEYDKPPSVKKDIDAKTLRDDSQMKGASRKRAQAVTKSKRYVPEQGEND